MLVGAAACDSQTRRPLINENPSALLSAAWLQATQGKGEKNMVILPYKDRLELLAKYLQQLIMESLGKRFDRNGAEVLQGITVLGNKGATDQHSYIQQLRDGLPDFFATFISVGNDGQTSGLEVDPATTSGDYLNGFLQGTRAALAEAGRPSLTISVRTVDAFTVGFLIALFERAVGLYASLININAYHQPGVESGKIAAARVLNLQKLVLKKLAGSLGKEFDTPALADELAYAESLDDLFMVCEHLAANPVRKVMASGHGTARKFSMRAV
jgi:glucose-6-phosphate isomerase